MGSKSRNENYLSGDGASPGKVFIGGLAKDTSYTAFNKHFGKYGEITDSVIMRDRFTGQPRGFGFITFADPSVVDNVIEDTHIINGKQVEIKRTIPKGSSHSRDFRTKKIFVGGIPSSVIEDDFKEFFSKYGKVVEHQIIRDHETNRSRGFGFIVFDSEEVVDDMLSKGNMIDMAGSQVEIKKAEPKKSSNGPPAPSYGSNSRSRLYNDSFGGFDSYPGYDGGFGPGPFRTPGLMGGRHSSGHNYGDAGEYGGGYSAFSSLGGYRGEGGFGYPSDRFGPYGGSFGGGYAGSGLGSYGRGAEGYGSYGGAGFSSGYDTGSGGGYGSSGGGYSSSSGGFYGRGGYSGSSRFHPYSR